MNNLSALFALTLIATVSAIAQSERPDGFSFGRDRGFESSFLHRRVSCKPDFLALSAPSRSRSSSSDNCACVRTSGFCHFRDLLEDGIGDPADQIRQHAHRQGAGRGARQGARSLNKV